MITQGEHLLRLADVAERLGISRRGVERLIASGKLPRPVKVGACSALPDSDVSTYIEQLKQERNR